MTNTNQQIIEEIFHAVGIAMTDSQNLADLGLWAKIQSRVSDKVGEALEAKDAEKLAIIENIPLPISDCKNGVCSVCIHQKAIKKYQAEQIKLINRE